MKEKILISYHMEAEALKDALRLALDIYASCAAKPDSINLPVSRIYVAFDIEDSRRVLDGKMKESEYICNHTFTFDVWAYEYFSFASEVQHLDVLLPLQDVLEDFRRESGLMVTSSAFMRRLRAFADSCPYIAELNPSVLCNVKPRDGRQNGRILRRLHDHDHCPTGPVVDHIYMRSNPVLSESPAPS